MPAIARTLGCDEQTVRNVIHAFNDTALGCLMKGSCMAFAIHRAFESDQAERLRALLHQSPRLFGQTLPLAAEVSFAQGITKELVTGETVRATLVRWPRQDLDHQP